MCILSVFVCADVVVWRCDLVPLMKLVDRVMAALDAHRGVSGVSKNGLGFLVHVAAAGENKVGCVVCSGQG